MKLSVLIATIVLVFTSCNAAAKDIVIEMRNQGSGGAMVFEPMFSAANVGDTIHFVPTDKGHNAETIEGIWPEGVPNAAGVMGQEFVIKLTKPGLYGFKCRPHFAFGMVALVRAGQAPSANKDAAQAVNLPRLAANRMALALKQAQ